MIITNEYLRGRIRRNLFRYFKKVIILLLILVFSLNVGSAQKIILDGSPSSGQWLQSKIYIQTLYRKEFINISGYITSITLYPYNTPDPMFDLCHGTIENATILIGESLQSTYNGSNWISIDSINPVFYGKIVFNCDSLEIQLNRPIFYSGNRNLIVGFLFENVIGDIYLNRSASIGSLISGSSFYSSTVLSDPPIPSRADNTTINIGLNVVPTIPDHFWVFPQKLDFNYSINSSDSINIYSGNSPVYSIIHLPSWLDRKNTSNSNTEGFQTLSKNYSYDNYILDSIMLTYGSSPDTFIIKVTQKKIPGIEEITPDSIRDKYNILQAFDYDNDEDFDYFCKSYSTNKYHILKYILNEGYELINIPEFPTSGCDEIGNIIVKDINNDNNIDIIGLEGGSPCNRNGRSFLIYNYVDSFKIQQNFIDPLSTDLKLLDLDNDGDEDILISGLNNDEATTLLYENISNTFNLRDDIVLTDAIGKNSIYDFDKDGDIDILMAGTDINGNTNSYLLVNDGNWSFRELPVNVQGYYYGETICGDYDSDGLADLGRIGTTSPQGGNVILYKQANNGTFTNLNYQLPPYPNGEIDFGDFNNDGHLDLITITSDVWGFNRLSDIYINTMGQFKKGEFGIVEFTDRRLVLSDINDDNNLDFILSGIHNNTHATRYYQNNFSSQNIRPNGPDSIWSKIIAGTVQFSWNKGSDNETPTEGLTYNIKIGTGFGEDNILSSNSHSSGKRKIIDFGNCFQDTSWEIKNLSPGMYYWAIQAIDNSFTGSEFSKMDSFMIHNVFEQQTTNLEDIDYGNSKWADLDNDSDLDVILMGGTNNYTDPNCITNIYYNDLGTFLHSPKDTLTGLYNLNPGIMYSDFDNDNLIDVIITGCKAWGGNCKTKIFKNSISGFIELPFQGISESNTTLDVADFNNDGLTDIALAGSKCYIYYNKGGGMFEEAYEFPDIYIGAVKAVDIDNDQDFDLILSSDKSRIYINNNGSFSSSFEFPSFKEGSIGILDFNKDNYIDFIIHGHSTVNGSYGNATVLYQNNIGKSFTKIESHIRGVSWSDVEIGDYNNDGWSDFIITGLSGGRINLLYENISGTSFKEKDYGFSPTSFGSLSFAAIYYDGILDLLVTGGDGFNFTKLYKNFGSWPNDPPSRPTNLHSDKVDYGVKIGWDASTDPQSGSTGLTYNVRVGTTHGGSEIMSPMSDLVTGYRRLPEMGNVQTNLGWRLDTLPQGTFYWSVQAIDQSFMGGAWAPEQTFTISVVRANFIADTVCFGLPTQFIDQSLTSETSITEWKWDFGDGTLSAARNPSYVYANSGDYFVKLIALSTDYSDTITKSISILPKPSTGFSSDIACQGSATTFTNSTFFNSLNVDNWQWDFGDGNISSSKDPGTHGYLNPGDYQVKLTAVAGNGCVDSIMKTVKVAEYPTAIITSNKAMEICDNDSATLSVGYVDYYQYQWNIGGVPITGSDSSSFIAKQAGDYSVQVTNKYGNCMVNSQPVSLSVKGSPLPQTIIANSEITFCAGDSVLLTVTENPEYVYNWQLDEGAIGSNKNNHIARTSGKYQVLVTNSIGCGSISHNSIQVTVNPLPSTPLVSLSGSTSFCDGDSLNMSVSYNSQNVYQWKTENGNILGQTGNLYSVKSSGVYSLDITNSFGCSIESHPVLVSVNPLPPRPEMDVQNYVEGICPGKDQITLSVTNSSIQYDYLWKRNGVPIDFATQSQYSALLVEGDYTVTAYSGECGNESERVSLNFKDVPETPTLIAKGPNIWYLASSNDSAADYRWFYNGLLVEGAKSPVYVANQQMGEYLVSISNGNGCYVQSGRMSIPDNTITSIEEIDPFENLKIYPNPTPGLFTIEMKNNLFGDLITRIFSENAREILNIKFDKETRHFKAEVDLSGQGKGIYIISFTLDKYKAERKLIVE